VGSKNSSYWRKVRKVWKLYRMNSSGEERVGDIYLTMDVTDP